MFNGNIAEHDACTLFYILSCRTEILGRVFIHFIDNAHPDDAVWRSTIRPDLVKMMFADRICRTVGVAMPAIRLFHTEKKIVTIHQ